ncbi:hypothetical protein NPIL_577761, partial [Nephila pilipes]
MGDEECSVLLEADSNAKSPSKGVTLRRMQGSTFLIQRGSKRYPALVRGLLSSPYGGGCSALSRWAMKGVLYCWKPILMQRVHRK